jgi:large subunit ribosomal protein L10
MPSQKNIDNLAKVKDKLKKTKSVVLADYRGLTVNLQQKLRRQVVAVGGEMLVLKNSILKLAFKDEKFKLEPLLDQLTGPTIVLLSYQDEIAPIKALAEFAKENELPQLKAGFLNKEPLTREQVEELSKLPTKIEMLAKTVGTIKAPLNGIVNVLSGNLRALVYALQAISKIKTI